MKGVYLIAGILMAALVGCGSSPHDPTHWKNLSGPLSRQQFYKDEYGCEEYAEDHFMGCMNASGWELK